MGKESGRTSVYHDRGYHHDEKVEEPIRASTHRVCFSTGLDGIYFCRIKLKMD